MAISITDHLDKDRNCWIEEPIQAILEGNLSKLDELLRGKDVDEIFCVQENFTLLHLAVGTNQENIVKYLLSRKADPNKRSHIGITPLHLSVLWNFPKILSQLLEYGGDPLLVDEDGYNSLEIAKKNNHHECLELLQNSLKKINSNKNLRKHKIDISNQDKILNTKECKVWNRNSDFLSKKLSNICTSTKPVKSSNDNVDKSSTNVFISEKDFEKVTNNEIRRQLMELGDNPGPVVDSTRCLYIKRLILLKSKEDKKDPDYINEISLILEDKLSLLQYLFLEREISNHFDDQNLKKKWRGGNQKMSFVYFLLDSRNTKDLPSRCCNLSFWETFQTFIFSIFYVGKGKQTRPYDHLIEAVNYQNKKNIKITAKINRIIDIWNSGHGIISLHCFHNIIQAEAHTREACILDALGLTNLTNQKRGEYYGIAETWSTEDKKKFGFYLLYRAVSIFLNEGERPLFKTDLVD